MNKLKVPYQVLYVHPWNSCKNVALFDFLYRMFTGMFTPPPQKKKSGEGATLLQLSLEVYHTV